MDGHPYIDFDGDGHGDNYDTSVQPDGAYEYVHNDHHGHMDAVAYDRDRDGLIDDMKVDDNHDGTFDRVLGDEEGHDGIMDRSEPIHVEPGHNHPYIDFNGDGHGDKYYTATDNYGQHFAHTDGHGHIDYEALDENRDGLIDRMWSDSNHDGRLDTEFVDDNGDGIMDRKYPV
jgi:hypothetical protein